MDRQFGKINPMFRRLAALTFFTALLVSCGSSVNAKSPNTYPTYNPFVPLDSTSLAQMSSTAQPLPTRTPGPTPTRASLAIKLQPTVMGGLSTTPTPDLPHALPTPRQDANQYTVQAGDTLGSIAQQYGISVETLMQANNLTDPNLLSIGQNLNIPPPQPGSAGPSFKIVPNSELVYGPASALFDIEGFIQQQGGYLSTYTDNVDGQSLTGAQVIAQVAQDYSVNPRLLLAILEYQSQWVTNKTPDPALNDYPLGFVEKNHVGLYHQLTWAANELNRGYYLWQANAVAAWVLNDSSVVPIDPTINAGTAGLQNLFAQLGDRPTWEKEVGPSGFIQAYTFLFGYPFNLAIEPLVPAYLTQPRMSLPFEKGDLWAFTGGPHAGWDSGSAWAALDFAPATVTGGCAPSDLWATAVADGLIVRSADGAVVEDLDNDGYEQTGWDVLYMHMASDGRVPAGTYVYTGDRIGHPSCEGGVANATHLHLARKYNGEWIAADGTLPFILDGWVSGGTGTEYDGTLKRGDLTLQAEEGVSDLNQISK